MVMADATRSPTKPVHLVPMEDTVMFPGAGSSALGSQVGSGAGQGAGDGHGGSSLGGAGPRSQASRPSRKGGGGGGGGGGGSAHSAGGGGSGAHDAHGGGHDDPYIQFKKQIGQKVGFSQFMWQFQQKQQHKQHLREMRSYVSEDVQHHRENVKKFEKYFFNPDAKAKAAAFEQQQLQRENKAMLKRLFKVSIAETPISAANNPSARLGVARKRNERLKAMREAKEAKLGYINTENRLLLKRISSVKGSFDYKKMEKDYKRHIKLRDAMRKVDNAKPKRGKHGKGGGGGGRGGRRKEGRRRARGGVGADTVGAQGNVRRLRGSGLELGTSLPALGEEAERARTQIEEEVRRRAAPQQPVQTAMITIDERRALVKSWRDAEAFRFQLADPETGAVRMLSLTDKEVDLLSERFGELVSMPNQSKITFLTSKLPVLLSGAM
jgi:hypothetical protein